MARTSPVRVGLALTLTLITLASTFAVLGGAVPAPHLPAATPAPLSRAGPASHAPSAATEAGGSAPPNAARMLTLARTLRDSGVPVGAVHLPNLAAAGLAHRSGLVGPTYSQAPAPMGVADLGVHNISGVLHGYTLYTSSAKGQITFNNASSTYIDGDGPDMFGVQLNTVLDNVSLSGNSTYQFWTQNFVSYTSSSGWLVFGDNVWNFSSRSGYFPSNALYSYGPNGTLADAIVYYASGPSFTVHYPFTLTFYNNASLVGGRSALYFNYTLSNSTMSRSGSFDQVVFNSNLTRLGGSARTPAFQVKGNGYDPIGLINDVELDVVGNNNGDTTVFTGVNATLSIATWSTSAGAYAPVTSAFNAGADTGETSTGLAVFWDGVSPVARMMPGPSLLVGLWNVSGSSGDRHLHLTLTPANAFIFVSPGGSFNASLAQWAPAATSPADLYLPNLGNFTLVAELSAFDPASVLVNSTANSTTSLVVSLVADPSRGIYTPLYAWNNAQLSSISSSGAGSPASPFVLENYQPGSLNPEFAQWNDFQFPVFSGIQLVHTTDWVTITPASFEINYPAWMQAQLVANGQPGSNDLQLLFFNASNVTLRNAAAISGWLSVSLSVFPVGSTVFWNSSDNLVAGNNFDDEGGALTFYGGTNNTVWGNWFLPTGTNATDPANLYNSGANETAVNLSETGDLLYNNAFLTPIDAITPTQDALSCQNRCEPAVYTDTWNISYAAASAWRIVHGVNLTGSIVSTTYQGGNYWWNYGTLSDPFDAIPYNDTGGITVAGDYLPLTFATFYTVTFKESGLAPATPWSVSSEGVVRTSNTSTLSLPSPDGTYPFTVAPVPGYTVPASHSFTVAGANVTVSLTFRLNYPVTFSPVGLSPRQSWSVTVSGAFHTVSDSAAGTTPIVFPLDNGSYNFTLGAVVGFTPTPLSGDFNVTGNAIAETITFARETNTTYPVVFGETGLATGTSWSVGLGSVQFNSTSAMLTLGLPNGSYPLRIVPVPGYNSSPSGTVTVQVSGAPPPHTQILYSPNAPPMNFTYPVRLHEQGLVRGTPWSVSLNGVTTTSSNSTIMLQEPDGMYAFTVLPVPGYAQSATTLVAYAAAVVVNPPPDNVTFTAIGAVSVQGSGLPSGTAWDWVVSGTNGSAAGAGNGSVPLEDGAYAFVVVASGFRASPAFTLFVVSGFNATSIDVTFTALSSGGGPPTGANASATSLTPEYEIIAALTAVGVALLIGLIYYYRRATAPPPPPPTPYEPGPAPTGGDSKSPPPPSGR